LKKSRAEGGLI